ncbi:MAG TPA: thermonuclease family protein [Alphaproteobacteria bacterium]
MAAAAPVHAATPADALEPGGEGVVALVVDGDTLALADGTVVRLVGLQAPKLALGRAGLSDWPLAEEARAALAELALGQRVTLRYGGRRSDRHGRALAHLVRADGVWIQDRMLARGMARVYSFADNRALVADMLASEAGARAALRGIWAHPFYRPRAADRLDGAIGSFQLVEGTVEAAALVRGRLYLNFGADWREDFTVTVAPRLRPDFERAFAALGLDSLEALAGRRVRVRGWIDRYNGPEIEATHPEQIELLADGRQTSRAAARGRGPSS